MQQKKQIELGKVFASSMHRQLLKRVLSIFNVSVREQIRKEF